MHTNPSTTEANRNSKIITESLQKAPQMRGSSFPQPQHTLNGQLKTTEWMHCKPFIAGVPSADQPSMNIPSFPHPNTEDTL
jgi:hypothetical protein